MIDWLRRQFRGYILFSQANRFYRAGKFDDAVATYQSALQFQTGRPVAPFNLGLALYKSGERRAARSEWEYVLELTESKDPYLHEQASIMLRQFS